MVGTMASNLIDLINGFPVSTAEATLLAGKASEIELEVLDHFEQFRNPLLRYAISFGLSTHDAEEIVQEVFLSLFQHLQSRKPRQNLPGWLFRVAHNLALKHRYADLKSIEATMYDTTISEKQLDPSPNPEEQLSQRQTRGRLLAVLQALPKEDQYCLRLRAEGLRYREIAGVVGISLGAVSMSLA